MRKPESETSLHYTELQPLLITCQQELLLCKVGVAVSVSIVEQYSVVYSSQETPDDVVALQRQLRSALEIPALVVSEETSPYMGSEGFTCPRYANRHCNPSPRQHIRLFFLYSCIA